MLDITEDKKTHATVKKQQLNIEIKIHSVLSRLLGVSQTPP